MKSKDAEKLVFFVNDKASMDALAWYVDIRIETLKTALVRAKDFEEVKGYQGAIEEVARFKNIREEVLNPRD